MTVLSHSGPCMTALIRLVVQACPSLTRAVGCSLFAPLGVIQLMAAAYRRLHPCRNWSRP